MSRRFKQISLLGAAIALAVIAALLATPQLRYTKDDLALRQASDPNAQVAESAPAKSGDSNGERLPHLKVEGTSIDYILAQATKETGNTFYLSHAYDGTKNSIGCPFVDWRTTTQATHTLVYAHGNAGGHILFNEIKHSDEQRVFDTIGQALLTFSGGGSRAYTPAFALSVDQGWP